jgi:flagellar hook-associated protein 3 FlgL
MIGNRVTNRMISDSALRGLQTNLSRNAALQEQLSSGKLLTRPSDNPGAAVSSMQLRTQQRLDTQYLSNIDNAAGRLATADSALTTISTMMIEAKTIMVNAQDRALPDASRAALSAQMETLQKGISDAYNTQWLGRPVFGGTAPGSVAINSDAEYVGNDLPVTTRIAREVSIRIDVGGKAAGADILPGLLGDMAANIAAGAVDDVDFFQNQIDVVANLINTAHGELGARAAQVESTKNRVDLEQLDLKTRITNNEDVDLPKAILELQASAVAYQASLGAAGKILQTSLLDYLR